MGNKQKNRQPAPTVTVGRHTRTLPVASPEALLAARVETREKKSQRERELEQQLTAEQAAHEATKFKHGIDDVVLLNAQVMHLDKIALTSLDNTVGNALKTHLKAGQPLKAFDPYAVISGWKARHGRAQRPAPKNASPLEGALPPARQEGRTPLGDAGAGDAALKASQERGARQRADVQRDREAYARRLRELGLEDPAQGSHRTLGGLGS